MRATVPLLESITFCLCPYRDMPIMENFRDALKGSASPDGAERVSVESIASAALGRWVLPRAETRPSYKDIRKADHLAEHIGLLAWEGRLFLLSMFYGQATAQWSHGTSW